MADENNKPGYEALYDEFISKFNKGQTSGEDVGDTIVRMAQYFSQANTELVYANINLSKKAADVEQTTDEQGKQISHSKADVIVASTTENLEYLKARAVVQNIEQYINALKSLQKGILNEYGHMNTA